MREKFLIFVLHLSHVKSLVCIGNQKNKKQRTYIDNKIDKESTYVLGNAKN